MNALTAPMMHAPSLTPDWCCFCGRHAIDRHHVIPRSQGGKNGPVLRLCGTGNSSGHHAMAHANRLHFKFEDSKWWALETKVPTKYQDALGMEGWRAL